MLNTKALEELPNIAQSLDVIRQKKEYALKIEVIGKELSKMDGVHDVANMRSWTKKLSVLQTQVRSRSYKVISFYLSVFRVSASMFLLSQEQCNHQEIKTLLFLKNFFFKNLLFKIKTLLILVLTQ